MGELERRTQNLLRRSMVRGQAALRRIATAPMLDAVALAGPHPLRLVAVPPDPWPGDPAAGAAILTGRFAHRGQVLRDGSAEHWKPEALWAARSLSPGWQRWLHGFAWARDLAATADRAQAQRLMEAHLRAWLSYHDRRPSIAWEAAVLARRLMAWISYAPLILASEDKVLRSAVLTSMARQARHLARSWTEAEDGAERLRAIVGLCFAGLFLPESNRERRALAALDATISRLVLADGGIVTRSPAELYMAFRDLLSLEAALKALDRPASPLMIKALDRMATMLKALTLGDRRLAQFNGASAELAAVLDDLDGPFARMAPMANGRHSGFQRLARGEIVVVVDAGPPPPQLLSRRHHAGTLSFEMSLGDERLVVNCGSLRAVPDPEALSFPGLPAQSLGILMRATATHSTLVVNDTNSAEITRNGLIGRGPRLVTSRREEVEGALLLDTRHDGYATRFGLEHRRRLFLDADGRGLRGEDSLVALRTRRRPLKFDIRFHLHPDVTVRIMDGGTACLLRLPSGRSVQFLARGGALSLDDSLYLGTPARPRPCRQIVINGNVQADENLVQWAFILNN